MQNGYKQQRLVHKMLTGQRSSKIFRLEKQLEHVKKLSSQNEGKRLKLEQLNRSKDVLEQQKLQIFTNRE